MQSVELQKHIDHERQTSVYSAQIVLDSITEAGARLITAKLVYPTMVHQDVNTHRTVSQSDDKQFDRWAADNGWIDVSRSSVSNRAMSSQNIIKQLLEDQFIPKFRYQTVTMQPGEFLTSVQQELAAAIWRDMLLTVISGVRRLEDLKVHKQWRNAPYSWSQWTTNVMTANEVWWKHFLWLREDRNARDEVQTISTLFREAYERSTPQLLRTGAWHLPFVSREEWVELGNNNATKISVSRCARTSYERQDEKLPYDEDLKLYERLSPIDGRPHDAPKEHVARAHQYKDHISGNFRGYDQFRKLEENARQ